MFVVTALETKKAALFGGGLGEVKILLRSWLLFWPPFTHFRIAMTVGNGICGEGKALLDGLADHGLIALDAPQPRRQEGAFGSFGGKQGERGHVISRGIGREAVVDTLTVQPRGLVPKTQETFFGGGRFLSPTAKRLLRELLLRRLLYGRRPLSTPPPTQGLPSYPPTRACLPLGSLRK